ncbi:MAG: DnaJ domain-containing protein [Chthoniobacterales bacterium]
MSDPFEVLGVERKCFFSEETLKAAYHQQAKILHPDSIHGDTAEFVHLNAAYRRLMNPAERLRAFIDLEFGSNSWTENSLPSKSELFERSSRILNTAAQWVSKLQESSGVVKSALLLQKPAMEAELDSICDAIEQWIGELTSALEETDKTASLRTVAHLSALVTDFTYARRWLKRIREQKFQLTLV